MILFDFSGAETFLAYRLGKAAVQQVREHPAYQAVGRHAGLFGSGITVNDIDQAIPGPSFAMTGSLFPSNLCFDAFTLGWQQAGRGSRTSRAWPA